MTASQTPWIQRAGRIALYLLLLCIPFSNAAIEILFPVLLVTWWTGWKPLSNRWSPAYSRVFFALLAYVGVCMGSVAYSDYPRVSLTGLIGKTFEYALFFLIAADIVRDSKVLERSMKFLFSAGWLVIAYAFMQEWVIHHPFTSAIPLDPIMRKPLNYVRMIGPYKNPNDLATFLTVVALVALGICSMRPRPQAAGALVLGLVATGCLIWTKSLGALLGFTVGLLVILFLVRKRSLWISIGALLILTLGFAVAIESHLLQVLTLADRGSQERRVMWHTAWMMIREKPWVGLGINTFMANYRSYTPNYSGWPAYAHNCFLQIAAETGLLGLSTFLWFLFCLFHALTRARPISPAGVGLIAGLAAFLVQSAFDTNLYALRQVTLFWTLAGVAFGASRQSA